MLTEKISNSMENSTDKAEINDFSYMRSKKKKGIKTSNFFDNKHMDVFKNKHFLVVEYLKASNFFWQQAYGYFLTVIVQRGRKHMEKKILGIDRQVLWKNKEFVFSGKEWFFVSSESARQILKGGGQEGGKKSNSPETKKATSQDTQLHSLEFARENHKKGEKK